MALASLAWLQTPDARHAARRELERLRLPLALVDDVLQDAAVRAWQTGRGGGPEPEDLVPYTYRVLQNAARDLYRRTRRRVTETPLDDLPPPAEPVLVIDVPGALEDACRRALHASLADTPWAGSAALSQLTFVVHPDVPVPTSVPAPVDGGDQQRVAWAALWLAGRHDCFAGPRETDDAARRRRRARALDAVTERLRDVVLLATEAAPV